MMRRTDLDKDTSLIQTRTLSDEDETTAVRTMGSKKSHCTELYMHKLLK